MAKVTTTSQGKEYATTTITTSSTPQYQYANNFTIIMIGWLLIHLVFGTVLGAVSSSISIRFGGIYRCAKCDISFSRIDSLQKHV